MRNTSHTRKPQKTHRTPKHHKVSSQRSRHVAAARQIRSSQRTRHVTAARHNWNSALDAAAGVLQRTGKPMTCPELITAMAEEGLWTGSKGKSSQAGLYTAMLREIDNKGAEARFDKIVP